MIDVARVLDSCKYTMNYTYLVRCSDNSLYAGWTNNIEKRIKAHNEGKGAKYTKTRRPVTLVYVETFDTKSEAMKREAALKKMTHKQKESLIASQSTDTGSQP